MIGDRVLEGYHHAENYSYIETLARIPSTVVDDAMGRLYAMSPRLKPLNRHTVCGQALPVRVPAGDNLYVHIALDMVSPGDVLVVQTDPNTNRATVGELMLRYLATKNIGGVIVDGYVRDIDYILNECPFAVYACGASPNGPYKNGPGEINADISCGDQPVSPGTIIKGDQDGIVVLKPEDLEECVDKAVAIADNEEVIVTAIETTGTFNRPWLGQLSDNHITETGENK